MKGFMKLFAATNTWKQRKTLSIVIICFPNLGKYGESWAFHRAEVPLDDQREVAEEKSTNHEEGGLGSLHILWGKSVLQCDQCYRVCGMGGYFEQKTLP